MRLSDVTQQLEEYIRTKEKTTFLSGFLQNSALNEAQRKIAEDVLNTIKNCEDVDEVVDEAISKAYQKLLEILVNFLAIRGEIKKGTSAERKQINNGGVILSNFFQNWHVYSDSTEWKSEEDIRVSLEKSGGTRLLCMLRAWQTLRNLDGIPMQVIDRKITSPPTSEDIKGKTAEEKAEIIINYLNIIIHDEAQIKTLNLARRVHAAMLNSSHPKVKAALKEMSLDTGNEIYARSFKMIKTINQSLEKEAKELIKHYLDKLALQYSQNDSSERPISYEALLCVMRMFGSEEQQAACENSAKRRSLYSNNMSPHNLR